MASLPLVLVSFLAVLAATSHHLEEVTHGLLDLFWVEITVVLSPVLSPVFSPVLATVASSSSPVALAPSASAAVATSSTPLASALWLRLSLGLWCLSVLGLVCSHSSSHHVSEESVVLIAGILLDIGLCVLHGLVNDGENSLWSLLWLVDLEEGMLVASSFFAHGAEVEVFADTALVSHSGDWGDAAAVTLYTCMDDFILW